MRNILIGILFASMWASASVATKIGLRVAQPLVLSNLRFFLAAILMLGFAFLVKKTPLPQGKTWQPLMIYGILNVTIYLSAYVYAMQHITAGIGTLGVATCPLIISVLNAVWVKEKITNNIWFGLLIGFVGVATATFPLLQNAAVTPLGMLLLLLSMFSYSVGTIFYQKQNWGALPRIAINGWQICFGGIFLLPFTYLSFDASQNHYNTTFWTTVWWLVIPVSILAVQLWLYLLKTEPLSASFWLFVCPIFGFIYAAIFTQEPITLYTIVGTFLVIIGLYIGRKEVK